MLLDKPYFLKNKDWYIEDNNLPNFLGGTNKRHYSLTIKAPPEAIKSYKEYYKQLEKVAE